MTSSFSVLSPVVSSGVVAPALPMGIEVAVKKKLFKTRGSGLWIDLEEFAGNLVFIKFPLVVCENFYVLEPMEGLYQGLVPENRWFLVPERCKSCYGFFAHPLEELKFHTEPRYLYCVSTELVESFLKTSGNREAWIWYLEVVKKSLQQATFESQDAHQEAIFGDVEFRMAAMFNHLMPYGVVSKHPLGSQLRLSKVEIGGLVGCSREMAGRVMNEWVQRDLIFYPDKAPGEIGRTFVIKHAQTQFFAPDLSYRGVTIRDYFTK